MLFYSHCCEFNILLVLRYCFALYHHPQENLNYFNNLVVENNDMHGSNIDEINLNNLMYYGMMAPQAIMPAQRNYENLYFQSLENYEVSSVPTTESKYPWIARVVHSTTAFYPQVCTAICVEEQIFITAARCISTLRTAITTIIYKHNRLSVRAFVLPSKPTKQMFEDIGLVVVEAGSYTGDWSTVRTINSKRSDHDYKWFESLKTLTHQYKVVGYAVEKYNHKAKQPDANFRLTELDVVVDSNICQVVYGQNVSPEFKLPCYHSCTVSEYNSKHERCSKYHGTEGGAVVDVRTNELLGVATWGVLSHIRELPVGFAVPNSDVYYKDLACARRIRNAVSSGQKKRYYQSLCLN